MARTISGFTIKSNHVHLYKGWLFEWLGGRSIRPIDPEGNPYDTDSEDFKEVSTAFLELTPMERRMTHIPQWEYCPNPELSPAVKTMTTKEWHIQQIAVFILGFLFGGVTLWATVCDHSQPEPPVPQHIESEAPDGAGASSGSGETTKPPSGGVGTLYRGASHTRTTAKH